MKSLKRTVRNSRLKTHNVVSAWLKPRMGAIGSRYRLAARIRKANGWAAKHPRRTFAYVVGTLLLVLVADVAFTLTRTETAEPELDMIANVEPIFNGFRTTRTSIAAPFWTWRHAASRYGRSLTPWWPYPSSHTRTP